MHGETGHLVPAGDPGAVAVRCSRSPPIRSGPREMGGAGRARQRERFGGEAMVEGYERAFEEALGGWPA